MGCSSAVAPPAMKLRTTTCHTWITFSQVSSARVKACTMTTVWVTISRFLRGSRSPITPAKSDTGTTGIRPTKFTKPSIKGESVIR
jgi:hypothetical protein